MTISSFLSAIRRRLNQSVTLRSLILALLVFSVSVLAVAGFYLIKGYAVPPMLYLIAGVIGVIGGGVYFWRNLVSMEKAASIADKTYGFKNGITSYLHLQKESEGYMVEAQRSWTEEQVSQADPKNIPITFSKGRAGLAAVLCAAACALAFIPASERIKNLQAEQELTEERTKEVAKQLKEYVEKMDKDLSEEEREFIDMDKLKIRVESLKPTKDKKEGTRQLAKLEEKAREMSKALQQKRDEQALKNAVEQLKKSLNQETQELGKDLDKDQMKKANEKLAKLTPKELPKNPNRKDLEKAKKELEKLRDVTKRLANSAASAQPSSPSEDMKKSQNGQHSPQSPENNGEQRAQKNSLGKQKPQIGKQGPEKAQMAQQGANEAPKNGKNQGLGQKMLELDEEARKLLEELKKQELAEMRDDGAEGGEFNKNLEELKEALKSMQNKLGQMKAKKKGQESLAGLGQSLAQCQSYMNGPPSSSLSLGPPSDKPGGLAPGTGFAENRKAPGEELKVNGNESQLTGQKGSGPSLTKIEDAQSGSGVSQKRTTGNAQSMGRQLESFVQRDDVPEELKQGVKEYFKTIHQTGEE